MHPHNSGTTAVTAPATAIEKANPRGAGLLLHITSLPSSFHVGDMGPRARQFADFLSRSGQKYWQLLPLNPVEPVAGYSPYSSFSSMAGNTLLISPEILSREGLLPKDKIDNTKESGINYKKAAEVKGPLLDIAFVNFEQRPKKEHEEFEKFCTAQAHWLDQHALYVVMKDHFGNKPWYVWPPEYKMRDEKKLAEFSDHNYTAIRKEKWFQYIFLKQWKELREYCNQRGIRLFGDLPFYISYDSADVWSNPDIFCLDEQGKMAGVGGVPPDYFNDAGQLWGMPVFRWDLLKERKYDWWIMRMKKNMELYDLLRLDHFRAFAAYWEVPANEETAINGQWRPGPGSDFFHTLKQSLGKLPFVAEDLGDIDEAVHKLRLEFNFPGMKVLQFAFAKNMPVSDYIPHNYTHNYIVYTGTHDNNTTRGWFNEAGKDDLKRLKEYTGMAVSEKNVHEVLSRMAYSSVADTVILPVQDVLGLDASARMNTPAGVVNNWLWQLPEGSLTSQHEKKLLRWTEMYNRK